MDHWKTQTTRQKKSPLISTSTVQPLIPHLLSNYGAKAPLSMFFAFTTICPSMSVGAIAFQQDRPQDHPQIIQVSNTGTVDSSTPLSVGRLWLCQIWKAVEESPKQSTILGKRNATSITLVWPPQGGRGVWMWLYWIRSKNGPPCPLGPPEIDQLKLHFLLMTITGIVQEGNQSCTQVRNPDPQSKQTIMILCEFFVTKAMDRAVRIDVYIFCGNIFIKIKQLDVGMSPPAFSFTLIVTLTFDPDLVLL